MSVRASDRGDPSENSLRSSLESAETEDRRSDPGGQQTISGNERKEGGTG
jgi:hypothetical protein